MSEKKPDELPAGAPAFALPFLAALFFYSCEESGCNQSPTAHHSSLWMGMLGFCGTAIIVCIVWTMHRLGAFE